MADNVKFRRIKLIKFAYWPSSIANSGKWRHQCVQLNETYGGWEGREERVDGNAAKNNADKNSPKGQPELFCVGLERLRLGWSSCLAQWKTSGSSRQIMYVYFGSHGFLDLVLQSGDLVLAEH